MATLLVKTLRCSNTEDMGADEIQIVVHAQQRRVVWSGEMNNGRVVAPNVSVPFQGQAQIQLVEEDWPDGNDNLGYHGVDGNVTAAVDRVARFTGDGADYTLEYRVIGDPSNEPSNRGQQSDCTQPTNPPAQNPSNRGGGGSGGRQPCPMGELIVHVRTTSGRAVQGANVAIPSLGLQKTSDAAGDARFGPVLQGTRRVEASKERMTPAPATVQATISSAPPPSEATVVLNDVTIINCNRFHKINEPPPAADVQWYVNIDPKEEHRYGRELRISAKVNPRMNGVRVYFRLESDPANRTLAAAQQASLLQTQAVTDAQGIATVRLKLSTYGGDRFRVHASLRQNAPFTATDSKPGPWLQVWKKLFFDVVEMARPTGGGAKFEWKGAIENTVITSFQNVFISLQDTGQRHVGTHVRNFETVEAGFKWADGYTSKIGVPWKVHFCVIDAAHPGSGSYGPTSTMVMETVSAVNASGIHVSSNLILVHEWSGQGITQAQYFHNARWNNFPANAVRLVAGNGRRAFQANFTGLPVTPTAAAPVNIRVTYRQAFSAGGWGGSNALHLLICRGHYEREFAVGFLSGTPDGQITTACIHEPGHALGLVPASVAWHDSVNVSHCINNTCTMWFQSTAGNNLFHPETVSDPGCRTYVRGADLSRSVMQTKWKFPR